MRDLFHSVTAVQAIAPATLSATTTGLAVDRKGFESVTFVLVTTQFATADNTTNFWEIEIEDSPDNSTWTDCTLQDVLFANKGTTELTNGRVARLNNGTAVTGIDVLDVTGASGGIYVCGYKGDQRYCRIILKETGSASSTVAAVAVKGHPQQTQNP